MVIPQISPTTPPQGKLTPVSPREYFKVIVSMLFIILVISVYTPRQKQVRNARGDRRDSSSRMFINN